MSNTDLDKLCDLAKTALNEGIPLKDRNAAAYQMNMILQPPFVLQLIEIARRASPQPVAVDEQAQDAVAAIIRDVCELDYSGEFDEEKMLAVTTDDLRLICERHVAQHPSAAPSIDTPEFQQLVECWRGEPYGTRSFENAWAELVAHIDSKLRGTAPSAQIADAWHHAVLNECMRIEAAYHADDPVRTLKELIDWHVQHSGSVAETIKVQADNYMRLTCGTQIADDHAGDELPSPKFESVMAIADEFGSGAKAYTADEVRSIVRATQHPSVPVQEQSDKVDMFAVEFIEKRAADYIGEHASNEPDTGAVAFNYGAAGREYYNTLVELAEKPCILDYDADKHSGYVKPARPSQDGEDARDAEMFQWLLKHRTWRTRYRVKNGIEQWQMLDDGEPWGQWGEPRKVIGAAMAATQQGGSKDS